MYEPKRGENSMFGSLGGMSFKTIDYLSRYYDLLFSSLALLCGGILIFQGWRLDPILLLCQMVSSGTAIFFIGETLSLRNTQRTNKKNVSFSNALPKYNRLFVNKNLNDQLNKLTVNTNYNLKFFQLFYSKYKLLNSADKDYTTPIEYVSKFVDSIL